jgi:hypothetical protein
MAVKMVPFASKFAPGETDCMVLRHNKGYGDSGSIEISYPFHEDTPNFRLSLREAMDLRNAIDEAFGIQLIEGRKQ